MRTARSLRHVPSTTAAGTLLLLLTSAVALSSCTEDKDSTENGPTLCMDPILAGELSGDGLCSEVTVRRSATGLAHIEAHNMRDLVWAQGYEMARDRLFHMDHFRRFTYGTRAEVFGPDFLDDDRTKRVFGFRQVAQEASDWWETHDPETFALLSAFAEGVNAYMHDMQEGENDALRPSELDRIDPAYVPEPWHPRDSLAILKIMIFGQTFQGDTLLFYFAAEFLTPAAAFQDLVRFEPLFPTHVLEEEPTRRTAAKIFSPRLPDAVAERLAHWRNEASALDEGERHALGAALRTLAEQLATARGLSAPGATGGSNAWAIGGSFTAHGGAILCNDPHMPPAVPTTLYPMHLVDRSVDDTGVFGFSVPGVPWFLIGHNRTSAWGMTNAFGDVTDIARETVVQRGRATLYNGDEIPMDIREERILVRREGGALGDVDEVVQQVRVVPHRGPLLNDILPPELGNTLANLNYIFSTLWTGFRPDTGEPEVMQRIFAARNVDEKIAALERFDGGIMSFTFADHTGDVAYLPAGPHVQRLRDIEEAPPYRYLDGTTGPDWGDNLPFDDIPRLVRPTKDYIVNANNAIGTQTLDNRPESGGHYFGHFFDLGTRAHRITERIEAWRGDTVTLDMNIQLQSDAHAVLAEVYLPPLLALADRCDEDDSHPRRCEAMTLLAQWDLQQRRDSPASTVYNAFFIQFAHDTYSAHIPGLIYPLLGGFLVNLAGRALIRLIENPDAAGGNWFGGDEPLALHHIDDALLRALDLALAALDAFHGDDLPLDQRTWDDVHQVSLHHPIWDDQTLGPEGMDGSVRTVLAADFAPVAPDGSLRTLPWSVNEIAVMRYCTELRPDGGPNTRYIVSGGVSGHLGSPHYDDQFPAWLEGDTFPVPFLPEAVEAAALSRTVLPPGFGATAP